MERNGWSQHPQNNRGNGRRRNQGNWQPYPNQRQRTNQGSSTTSDRSQNRPQPQPQFQPQPRFQPPQGHETSSYRDEEDIEHHFNFHFHHHFDSPTYNGPMQTNDSEQIRRLQGHIDRLTQQLRIYLIQLWNHSTELSKVLETSIQVYRDTYPNIELTQVFYPEGVTQNANGNANGNMNATVEDASETE